MLGKNRKIIQDVGVDVQIVPKNALCQQKPSVLARNSLEFQSNDPGVNILAWNLLIEIDCGLVPGVKGYYQDHWVGVNRSIFESGILILLSKSPTRLDQKFSENHFLCLG